MNIDEFLLLVVFILGAVSGMSGDNEQK
jgi:hypothetical protein